MTPPCLVSSIVNILWHIGGYAVLVFAVSFGRYALPALEIVKVQQEAAVVVLYLIFQHPSLNSNLYTLPRTGIGRGVLREVPVAPLGANISDRRNA